MTHPRIVVPLPIRAASATDKQQLYIKTEYLEMVRRAGAEPVAALPLEPFDTSAAEDAGCSGLLLVGGPDLDADVYGEPPHPATRPGHPLWWRAARAWLEWAQRGEIPVLGICLGCQELNVFRGGTLVQHLPDRSRVVHNIPGSNYSRHRIVITAPVLSAAIAPGAVEVNSSHHQAVDRLGRGLVVAARADDGTIEAVEDAEGRFVVGVQWHPESIAGEDTTLRLMAAFVQAARARRQRGGKT